MPRQHSPSLNPYVGQTAFLIVLCAAGVLLSPWRVSAQEIQRESDGTVSIRADAIPLGRLLEAVARVTPFQKLVLDPSTADRPVSVTLTAVSMRHALTDILRAAEVDYALATDEDGKSVRLIAGNKTFVASAQRAQAATPPSVASERVEDVVVFRPPKQVPADSSTTDAPDTSAGIAGQPADPFAGVQRSQELERALSVPRLHVPPGGIVELPFPGPDGLPQIAIMPPKGVGPVLPFPDAPLPKAPMGQPAPAATPRQGGASPVADPHLQELIEALTPKPGSGK